MTKALTTHKDQRNGVSARQVAEEAGVSIMTVSRALNGVPGVSKATRDKVKQIADRLGYSPNSAASVLRKGASMTIAMLLDSSLGIRGEFHSDTLAGFEEVISEAGYDLLLMVPKREDGISGLVQRLIASTRCDAVVTRFDQIQNEDLRLLSNLHVPLVLALSASNRFQNSELRFSSAAFDNRTGIARAIRHLVSLGHSRIAFLGGTEGWLDSEERIEGYRDEMKNQGLDIREPWIRSCDFGDGVDSGSEAMDAVLSAEVPGPTAVVCASDKIAAGALSCARRWNISVPEDLSIVGFDDDGWTSYSVPPLTTVRQDGFEYGHVLGRLILEELRNPGAMGRHVMIETPLVVRQSTAPPRKK